MAFQTLMIPILFLLLVASRGATRQQPTCVKKLLPCQSFLKGDARPPPTCCGPLKELLEGDSKCMCSLLENEALMKSFNVTRDEALGFPKKCGATADLSLCNNGTSAATPSPPVPSTPPPPAKESPKSAAAVPLLKSVSGVDAAMMMAIVVVFVTSLLM